MRGELSHELEVSVGASEMWEIYGSLKLASLVVELLPNFIDKIEVVEGNGEVGTVLNLIFPSGTPGLTSYKQKFITLDDEKRMKEVDVIEGGYLELGFTLYRVRVEVIEKEANSCIIRSTIIYELDDDSVANASMVSTNAAGQIAEIISKHIIEKKSKA